MVAFADKMSAEDRFKIAIRRGQNFRQTGAAKKRTQFWNQWRQTNCWSDRLRSVFVPEKWSYFLHQVPVKNWSCCGSLAVG